MDSGPRPHHHPPPPPPGGGREDCWSEGGTGCLVEAWGDRYLHLSRGNLRQKDWKEVADAVNARQETLGKPRKTDIQCKNRIDTLKKKYKLEKSKPGPSQWSFFSRLDLLIGPNSAPAALKKLPPPPGPFLKPHPGLTFTVKHRSPNPNHKPNPNPSAAIYSGGSSSRSRMNSPGSTDSSRGDSGGGNDDDDDEEEDEDEDDEDNGMFDAVSAVKRQRRLGGLGGGGGMDGAFGELARAIVKFGEIYERVESSKQQQMMELERQRMEFAKELEFQRMQMFMETQLELEKMKRPKYDSGSGKR